MHRPMDTLMASKAFSVNTLPTQSHQMGEMFNGKDIMLIGKVA